MATAQIRPATADDAKSIAEIYQYYVRTTTSNFEFDPPSAEEIATRMEDVRKTNLPYLVAEIEDRVVAYAYATQFRPRPAYRFTVENTLYVDKNSVGRGIGRQLLVALISACREAGAKQMIAGLGGENPASEALHLSLGFERIGVLRNVGFKFERWLNLTLMQRTL